MGEYAEMVLDGTLCQSCGEFMGGESGFARTCPSCLAEFEHKHRPPASKVKCPTCGKKVKAVGLADHQRDAHGTSPTTNSQGEN